MLPIWTLNIRLFIIISGHLREGSSAEMQLVYSATLAAPTGPSCHRKTSYHLTKSWKLILSLSLLRSHYHKRRLHWFLSVEHPLCRSGHLSYWHIKQVKINWKILSWEHKSKRSLEWMVEGRISNWIPTHQGPISALAYSLYTNTE